MSQRGTIYLLHFDQAIGSSKARGRAQHYIGWTDNLEQRLEAHRSGSGAAITKYLKQQGISFKLARTWSHASRRDERKLKDKKRAKAFCPFCNDSPRIPSHLSWP
jgi:predicted GIY-YIG superfamily endonuclease